MTLPPGLFWLQDLPKVGETPDMKKLSELALTEGLLEEIEGSATYQDINNVLFKGQLIPENTEAVPI